MLTVVKLLSLEWVVLGWLISLQYISTTTTIESRTSLPCVCNVLESDVQCDCETNKRFDAQFVISNGLVWDSNLSIQGTPEFHQASTYISSVLNEIFEKSDISSEFLTAQIYKFSNQGNNAVCCKFKVLLKMDSSLNSEHLAYEFAAGLDGEGALPGDVEEAYFVQYDTIDFETDDDTTITEASCIDEECSSSLSNVVIIILSVLIVVFTVFAYVLAFMIWMKCCRNRANYERPKPISHGQQLQPRQQRGDQIDTIYEEIPYDTNSLNTGDAENANGVMALPRNDDVAYRSKWDVLAPTRSDVPFHTRDAGGQVQFELPERNSSQMHYVYSANYRTPYNNAPPSFSPMRPIVEDADWRDSRPSRGAPITTYTHDHPRNPPQLTPAGTYDQASQSNYPEDIFRPEDANQTTYYEAPRTERSNRSSNRNLEVFSVLYRQPDSSAGYKPTV